MIGLVWGTNQPQKQTVGSSQAKQIAPRNPSRWRLYVWNLTAGTIVYLREGEAGTAPDGVPVFGQGGDEFPFTDEVYAISDGTSDVRALEVTLSPFAWGLLSIWRRWIGDRS